MIPQAGNSLLAAQMYGNAGSTVSNRNSAPVRRPEFEPAAREARDLKATPEKSRNFPVDRVELRGTTEAPLTQETALAVQEEAGRDVQDASRFAREAPGTEARYFEMPGSRLDITV